MNWNLTADEIAFRDEARGWLRTHAPREPLGSMDTADGFEQHREWEGRLFEAGWVAVDWPVEFGGRGASIVEWLLFEEEYHAAGGPGRISQNGIFLLAPTLLAFGTSAQKERWLRRMASAQDVWAQAWSEPEAGSDLAAIRSRAERIEGGWLLSGQKAWSTRASLADWAFGLFRSDPESMRHHGLTYFAFPLSATGVTVMPTGRFDGAVVFGDIFLDDVFVPDADVIGDVGAGWTVAMATTTPERGMTLRSPGRFLATAARLASLRRKVDVDSAEIDARLVDCFVDAHAYRARGFEVAGRLLAADQLGAETSVDKLFWSQLDLRLHRIALELLALHSTDLDARRQWFDGFVFALSGPIYAGANEIQRNLVAQRVLGMPRK